MGYLRENGVETGWVPGCPIALPIHYIDVLVSHCSMNSVCLCLQPKFLVCDLVVLKGTDSSSQLLSFTAAHLASFTNISYYKFS